MRKTMCVLTVIGITLLLNVLASASEVTSITFASEEWEGVTNADGSGLCWELFGMVYEPVGIKMEFEIIPYARSTKMVQEKQVDAAVGVYFEEFDQALFSKFYYLQDIVLVIFPKGRVENWRGEADLKGNIGWIRGYAFDEYLQGNVKFYEVDNRNSGLKMLEAGRLDFFLDTEVELLGALDEGVIDKDQYQVETILTLNVHLAFSDNERGKELMDIFDTRMGELVKSGELKALYERWELTYPFEE